MENVTDETSNPFGMSVPGGAAYGYGDANADFHFIGDSPARHGGATTGVPFTETEAGRRLQSVLHEVGFAAEAYSDEPRLSNTFLSYAHPGVTEGEPTDAEYADQERFLDAELRAINAHILFAVGDRALAYALDQHTSLLDKIAPDTAARHAEQVRGRGFLVVPVREPEEWTDADRAALVSTITDLLDSDYRQTKGVATTIG
ncbi:uracil-DNA glycosylase family protein [Halosegnis marinus]|uniref:Uracil-DNA glycosylase family protein n=1 Tax=Halosegnis marinus TaxID=3034023 RepID=A0ABD5ZJS1_9EURY|nr:uracil-DNA glycosylase family protein [Halosegnis sp. DT85]